MNFRDLTTKQLDVFEQIAINNDAGHHYATIKALLRRGLIESYRVPFSANGFTGYDKHYRVPMAIHREWCEWCAKQEANR